ncbi:hypothetical protein V5G28_030765 [Scytonema sp. PRP1]
MLEILKATTPSWRLALPLRNCPNATREVRSPLAVPVLEALCTSPELR